MFEHVHPALLVWSLLAIPVSGLSFLITFQTNLAISVFHLFLAIMNIAGLFVLVTGVFHDYAEESSDWETEQEPEQVGSWSLIGLALLFVASLFVGFFFGRIQPSIWVPYELYPLSEIGISPNSFYSFSTDVFGTWFSVVPGEENMKKTFIVLQKVYEDTDIVNVPFAVQPAILLGNGIWSVEHVFLGQYPMSFMFSVFISGICLDVSSARTGTPLTGWLIHALFNSILLAFGFLAGGFIKLVPS